MNRIMPEMIKEKSKLESIYHTFLINTLKIFKENDLKTGVYFWIQAKDTNNYVMYYFGEEGMTENKLTINEKELEIVETLLQKDGFKTIMTENNNRLITIKKDKILKYLENNKQLLSKMPITPFAETRRRK